MKKFSGGGFLVLALASLAPDLAMMASERFIQYPGGSLELKSILEQARIWPWSGLLFGLLFSAFAIPLHGNYKRLGSPEIITFTMFATLIQFFVPVFVSFLQGFLLHFGLPPMVLFGVLYAGALAFMASKILLADIGLGVILLAMIIGGGVRALPLMYEGFAPIANYWYFFVGTFIAFFVALKKR